MKQIISNYTFNAAAKTVTFTDFTTIVLERVLLITNVNTNTIIYNFAATGVGGTVAGNVLTLDYNTTAMTNSDALSIQYETAPGDPDYSRVVNIETERKTWRRNFDGAALNTTYWDLIQTGAGQSVTVSGGTLTMATGTTASSETIIRSKESFQMPFRVQWWHHISQRIANQEFYLEITNAAGNTYVGWLFDGTTVTLAKTTHMNQGISLPASPTGTLTVTTTATNPSIREIDARADAVDFNDRAADSTAAATSRTSKNRTILDPGEEYFIQMRIKNLAVAPASNTNMILESVMVQDMTKLVAEIASGRGNAVAGRSIPVVFGATPAVTINSGDTRLSLPSTSATTSPGLTITNVLTATAASSNVVNIKAAVGKVLGWDLHNKSAATRYVKFYNTATTPTMGTTAAIFQISIPAGGRATMPSNHGRQFATGIAYAITEGASLTDNTIAGITANDVVGIIETV